MEQKIDLHMHSTCSDGSLRPVELVRKYHDEGYQTIALTDHDGIDGVEEAKIAGQALDIEVMTGIEFSTALSVDSKEWTGPDVKIELHILGYQFDTKDPALTSRLEDIRRARADRNQRLLQLFREKGYDIDWEDLLQRPDQEYIGKPNFALALVRKGYAETVADAFAPGGILESDWVRAVRKEKVSSQEAVRLIRGAGGIPVLAHPMKIRNIGSKGSEDYWKILRLILDVLKREGLGGLECFHPSADPDQALTLADLAGEYHLHITRGSDYHGPEFE